MNDRLDDKDVGSSKSDQYDEQMNVKSQQSQNVVSKDNFGEMDFATIEKSQALAEEQNFSGEQEQHENEENETSEKIEIEQSKKSLEVENKNNDSEKQESSKIEEPKTEEPTLPTSRRLKRTPVLIRRREKREKVDLTNCRIGFIGAGKMTEVIVKGLLEINKIDPKRIFVSSKSGKNHDHFIQLGITVTKRNYNIFGRLDCDIVFLAFHGFVIRQLYKSGGIRPLALTTNFIPYQHHPVYILSLIGGCSLGDIKRTLLNPDHPEKYQVEIHRIMLNHSVGYGLGLGAIDVEPDSKNCAPIIRDLLTPLCRLEFIQESNMDIACAVGGNGLTFCYYFLASIADGAFKMGLPKVLATKIAARTLQSAAASLLESGKHPVDLRDSCTSPSGPAIYGLHVLDKADCASGIAAAVEATYRRIKELVENPMT